MPNVTVMFANTKGGVGKSTLAYLTAIYLAATERVRIVAVDLDKQKSLSNALGRFQTEQMRVQDWSGAFHGERLERGKLANQVHEAKAASDVLIIDTPAGFAASELLTFIQPDLIVTPLTASDADVFTTQAYLQEMTAALAELQAAEPGLNPPQILVIPNQVYDADCVSHVRDSLRGLRVQIGRPLPHSMEFREIFRFTRGDKNVGRVVRRESKFFGWLAERIMGRLHSNGLESGDERRARRFFSLNNA